MQNKMTPTISLYNKSTQNESKTQNGRPEAIKVSEMKTDDACQGT